MNLQRISMRQSDGCGQSCVSYCTSSGQINYGPSVQRSVELPPPLAIVMLICICLTTTMDHSFWSHLWYWTLLLSCFSMQCHTEISCLYILLLTFRNRQRNTGTITCSVCLQDFQTPITCKCLTLVWVCGFWTVSLSASDYLQTQQCLYFFLALY